MKFVVCIIILTFSILISLVTVAVRADTSNHIIKEGFSSSSGMSGAGSDIPPPLPPPVVPPQSYTIPPSLASIFPGFGGGAGAGFHKNLDFSIGSGAGAGAGYGPLLAGLIPGLGAPTPAVVPPPPPVGGASIPPDILPSVDPYLGGSSGYMGIPGFMGPSYIPYSWLGSALGAKGDFLFPIVIFMFVVVGIWTVAQFLLAFIVPMIAAKLAVGKSLLAAKGFKRRDIPDPMADHEDDLEDATLNILPSLDNYVDKYETDDW